jgi:pyruvate/2-oxoglutarate dehydrogenase complex dihydrolipoamide acyltransferase (E2) component
MKVEIKVPNVTLEEQNGTLMHWFKNDGDQVKEKEEIADAMIGKLTVTIESPASGKLNIIVKENEEIKQGQVIGTVEI